MGAFCGPVRKDSGCGMKASVYLSDHLMSDGRVYEDRMARGCSKAGKKRFYQSVLIS